MKTEPTTKCSEQWFEHAWEDTTPNLVYATYPPQYPDRQETCKNCWLTRYHRTKQEKWFEYEMWEVHKVEIYNWNITQNTTTWNNSWILRNITGWTCIAKQ